MLSIDTRAARITWTVFLVLGAIAFVYLAREPILLFIFAMFFAYMVSPVLNLVDRYTPDRVPRTVSLAVVYLLLIGIIGKVVITFGSRAINEASNLASRLPELIKTKGSLHDYPLLAWIEPWVPQVRQFLSDNLGSGAEQVMPLLTKAGMGLRAGLGTIVFIVLILILSFFFLKDAEELRKMLLNAVRDDARRAMFDKILTDVNILIGEYIRALVLLSIAAFFSSLLFFEFTGMQYAVLLASIFALFEFVPVLGPFSALVIAIIAAIFNGYPHIYAMVIFFVCYRVFQDYVLAPHLMSAGVKIHPLLVLFGVLTGEQLAGIAGMFLSIPVMATLRIIWVHASRNR